MPLSTLREYPRIGGVIGYGPVGGSGIWTLQERYALEDDFYDDVSLLLHMNGSNGSTTFLDSSRFRHTVTVEGNAQISTAQSRFGGASAVAGSSTNFLWGSNRLLLPAGDAFAYGTGDFTVEAWVNMPSFGDRSFWTQSISGTNYFVCGVSTGAAPIFTFATSGGGTSATGLVITANTWNHIAIVRKDGSVTVYTNGVGGTPVSCTQNFSNTTYIPTIGSYNHNSGQLVFSGYIDELRITKGVARYTGSFTPPQRAFLP